MSDNDGQQATYEQVNERLKEIVEQVSDENMPLDDALGLFEEAVKLGMQASSMLEQDIAQRDAEAESAGDTYIEPMAESTDEQQL